MSTWEDDGHHYGYFTRLIEEEYCMTDKQSLRKLVDDFFRCVICRVTVPMGQKRICESCAEQERTECARQAEADLCI